MRYIDRDEKGKVTGTYNVEQFRGQEELLDNHPDLLFKNRDDLVSETKESMIRERMTKILRDQAIAQLKLEGKL